MDTKNIPPLEWVIIQSREARMQSTALGWIIEDVCALSKQLRAEAVQLRLQAKEQRAKWLDVIT